MLVLLFMLAPTALTPLSQPHTATTQPATSQETPSLPSLPKHLDFGSIQQTISDFLTWVSQSVIHPFQFGSFTSSLNWHPIIPSVYAGEAKTVTSNGAGTIAVDAPSEIGATGTGTGESVNITTAANWELIVISVTSSGSTGPNSVTVNSIAASSLTTAAYSTTVLVSFYYYFMNVAGTYAVSVGYANSTYHAWDAVAYSGAAEITPWFDSGSTATADNSGSSVQTASVTVGTGTSGRMIIAAVGGVWASDSSTSIVIAATKGTQRHTSDLAGSGSNYPVSDSLTEYKSNSSTAMTATLTDSGATIAWATVGVSIIPAGTAYIDTSVTDAWGGSGGAGKFVAANKQYLSLADSDDWYFGTGNLVIDFQANFNSLPAAGAHLGLYEQYQDSNNFFECRVDGVDSSHVNWQFRLKDAAGVNWELDASNSVMSTGTWYHIAFVRSANSWKIFQAGTQILSSTKTDAVPDLSGSAYIGYSPFLGSGSNFDGWLNELRVSKGTDRGWTSNFTPPTAPYLSDGYTVLLLHMQGSNGSTIFTDSENIYGESASLSATGAFSASRQANLPRTSSLSAMGSFMALKTIVKQAALVVTGTFNPTRIESLSRSAALSPTSSFIASIQSTLMRVASLLVTGTFSASKVSSLYRSTQLSSTGIFLASTQVAMQRSASLQATGSFISSIAHSLYRVATFGSSGTFTAIRTVSYLRSAQLASTGNFLSSISKFFSRSAPLSITGSFTASRIASYYRSAGILVSSTFTATVLSTPQPIIPVVPPPSSTGMTTLQPPPASAVLVGAMTATPIYYLLPSATVSADVTILNAQSHPIDVSLHYILTDATGAKVFESTQPVTVGSGSETFTVYATITQPGPYKIMVDVTGGQITNIQPIYAQQQRNVDFWAVWWGPVLIWGIIAALATAIFLTKIYTDQE